MLGWANELQWSRFGPVGHDLNLPPSDEIQADKAVTSLVERLPFPELIESSQRVELVCVGQFDGSQSHWLDLEHLLFSRQSGCGRFGVSEKDLPNRAEYSMTVAER